MKLTAFGPILQKFEKKNIANFEKKKEIWMKPSSIWMIQSKLGKKFRPLYDIISNWDKLLENGIGIIGNKTIQRLRRNQ